MTTVSLWPRAGGSQQRDDAETSTLSTGASVGRAGRSRLFGRQHAVKGGRQPVAGLPARSLE
eukprot:11163152-Lingulodinium_polyedra.AAC.1